MSGAWRRRKSAWRVAGILGDASSLPGVRLVLVGDGPARASLQAGNPSLIFAGMRVGEDLAMHYASGDLFLFPSTTETFGNVTVEAMASGLAVIAYDYAAAAEYIEHAENGLLAGFDNPREFASLAANLVNAPERIARLGATRGRPPSASTGSNVHDDFEAALRDIVATQDRITSGKDEVCLSVEASG